MLVDVVRYRTWPVSFQLQAPGDTVPIALVTALARLRIPYMAVRSSVIPDTYLIRGLSLLLSFVLFTSC